MPENAPTPKRIDLSTYTETTRRAVYDAVVAIFFNPTPEEIAAAQADPENHPVITYSPDDAGLKVYHELGRWFRRELFLVEEVPTVPHGILLDDA